MKLLNELLVLSNLNEAKAGNLFGVDIYDDGGDLLVTIDDKTQHKIWAGKFDCSSNNLKSLEYCPKEINGEFYCIDNHLKNLDHGPSIVHGNYDCHYNKLTSLKGSPDIVYGNFDCYDNMLTSLEGCPSTIHGYMDIRDNKLTSLKDIHKYIKRMDNTLYAEENTITSHILGVLLIDRCSELQIDNHWVSDIVNKYLPNHEGRKGLLKCKGELVDAGFEKFAQL